MKLPINPIRYFSYFMAVCCIGLKKDKYLPYWLRTSQAKKYPFMSHKLWDNFNMVYGIGGGEKNKEDKILQLFMDNNLPINDKKNANELLTNLIYHYDYKLAIKVFEKYNLQYLITEKQANKFYFMSDYRGTEELKKENKSLEKQLKITLLNKLKVTPLSTIKEILNTKIDTLFDGNLWDLTLYQEPQEVIEAMLKHVEFTLTSKNTNQIMLNKNSPFDISFIRKLENKGLNIKQFVIDLYNINNYKITDKEAYYQTSLDYIKTVNPNLYKAIKDNDTLKNAEKTKAKIVKEALVDLRNQEQKISEKQTENVTCINTDTDTDNDNENKEVKKHLNNIVTRKRKM